jgi:hypothetical protein
MVESYEVLTLIEANRLDRQRHFSLLLSLSENKNEVINSLNQYYNEFIITTKKSRIPVNSSEDKTYGNDPSIQIFLEGKI